MGYDNATLVSLLLDADEKMGGGTYYQEAADAITALQARVAEQLAHVVRAEAAYTRTQQVLDETVESMGNTIIRLESDLAAARALLREVHNWMPKGNRKLFERIDAAIAGERKP